MNEIIAGKKNIETDIDNILQKLAENQYNENTKKYFFLTHIPFTKLKIKGIGSLDNDDENETFTSEEELLRNIVSSGEHSTFSVIHGDPGTGKTNLISWLHSRYLQKDSENVVIYLKRTDNTLKATLNVLLRAEEQENDAHKFFTEKERATIKNNIYEIERKSDKDIRMNLYTQLKGVVSSGSDNNDPPFGGGDAKKKSREWKYIYDFIHNEDVQNAFIEKNASFSRLQKLIKSGDSNTENKLNAIDFSEIFDESSFIYVNGEGNGQTFQEYLINSPEQSSITRNVVKFLQMHSDPKTQQKYPEFYRDLADYLNKKVTIIIQRTVRQQIKFDEIFKNIRKRLKAQNRKICIFVEDITKMASISEDLIEAMLPEDDDELAPVLGVVGITPNYYAQLSSATQDRITYDIELKGETLLGNDIEKDPSQLVRFAAYYLNALYLDSAKIDNWYRDGDAELQPIPLATVKDPFFIQDDGNKLSIYPFTVNALKNFFLLMDAKDQTPRGLVKILNMVTKEFFLDRDRFFTSKKEKALSGKNQVVNWSLDLDDKNRKIGDPEQAEERSYLIRVWGNATLDKGEGLFGGLPQSVYQEFGIQIPEEYFHKTSKNTSSTIPLSRTVASKIKETRQFAHSNVMKEEDTEEFKKFKQNLEIVRNWIHGDVDAFPIKDKNSSEDIRQWILIYLEQHRYLPSSFITTVGSGFAIEIGTKNTTTNSIVLPKNQETGRLLEAFYRYDYALKLKNKKKSDGALFNWEYPGSIEKYKFMDYVTMLAWIEKHGESIAKKILSSTNLTLEEIQLHSIYAIYLIKSFHGTVNLHKDSKDVLTDLFSYSPNDFMAYSDPKKTHHVDSWNDAANAIFKKEDPIARSLYNRVVSVFQVYMGSINNKTIDNGGKKSRVGFALDSSAILKSIDKLKSSHGNIQEMNISWDKLPKSIQNGDKTKIRTLIPDHELVFLYWFQKQWNAIKNEYDKKFSEITNKLLGILGDHLTEDDWNNIIDKTKELCDMNTLTWKNKCEPLLTCDKSDYEHIQQFLHPQKLDSVPDVLYTMFDTDFSMDGNPSIIHTLGDINADSKIAHSNSDETEQKIKGIRYKYEQICHRYNELDNLMKNIIDRK